MLNKGIEAHSGDFFSRPYAEYYLNKKYKFRTYKKYSDPKYGDIFSGVVSLPSSSGSFAAIAYSIGGGDFASGMLVRRDGTPAIILTHESFTQSELAEALDYWEKDVEKIFCLHEKSCGAVLFTDSDGERKYLIIRMNMGHCGLPKGHVEKFETEEMAALREIFEETGVRAEIIPGFREIVEYRISPITFKTSVYYIARFTDTDIKIQPSEIRDYKLCKCSEAREHITHNNDRAVFDAAVKWLSENCPEK